MALLELDTGNGVVLVEFSPGPGLAGVSDADPTAVIAKAESSLDDVLDAITRIGDAACKRLSKLKIEQAALELGIKFGGKGKFFFAEIAGEATLTVRLTLKGCA